MGQAFDFVKHTIHIYYMQFTILAILHVQFGGIRHTWCYVTITTTHHQNILSSQDETVISIKP